MRKSAILIAFLITSALLSAQVPTSCFEIESILVDACTEGNNCGDDSAPACQCEGKNEMFRFIIGPDDLNTDDMDVEWANGTNPWQGVCQNGNTADIIEELNGTILNCGHLVEPTGSVLPAGSDVLMITSEDMCTTSNSFAGLSDTLIVIFQCSGNYFGHFANQNNTGNDLRTLEVDFGAGCADEVTYDRSELVDEGGANVPSDGARVDFTWGGDATYVNEGCNAPVEQSEFDAGANVDLCPGDIINLNPVFASEYIDLFWSGGLGSFSDINDPYASYFPSVDDPEEFTLTLNATSCSGPITDEVEVYNLSNALTGVTSSLGDTICEGEVTEVTPMGTSTFYFEDSIGLFSDFFEVTETGVYNVSVTNACGITEESISITVIAPPIVEVTSADIEMICDGDGILLEAIGENGLIEWSTSDVGLSILVDTEGVYYASIENDCATVIDSVEVQVIEAPAVSIEPEGMLELCEGSTLELSAIGDDSNIYSWSTDEEGQVITVDEIGVYTVIAENTCGQAEDMVEVVFGGNLPVADISFSDDLLICAGESIVLTGTGGDTYQWNGDPADADLVVDQPGEFVLEAINDCGSDETSLFVSADEEAEAFILGGPQFAICNGQQAIVQGGGTGSLTWSNGNSGGIQSFTNSGSYYLVATAACGMDTAFFEVIEEQVIAVASASPLLGEAPLFVEFESDNNNASTIQWFFDEDAGDFGQQSQYTFIEEGLQEVVVEVTSALGCTDQTSIFINVGACPFALYVPSAFTPDGDGVNDRLKIEGNCLGKLEWRIYDRWGREVFFASDASHQWNGADVSGYAVLNGIYAYTIIVTDDNGVVRQVNGSVTVLR